MRLPKIVDVLVLRVAVPLVIMAAILAIGTHLSDRVTTREIADVRARSIYAGGDDQVIRVSASEIDAEARANRNITFDRYSGHRLVISGNFGLVRQTNGNDEHLRYVIYQGSMNETHSHIRLWLDPAHPMAVGSRPPEVLCTGMTNRGNMQISDCRATSL